MTVILLIKLLVALAVAFSVDEMVQCDSTLERLFQFCFVVFSTFLVALGFTNH